MLEWWVCAEGPFTTMIGSRRRRATPGRRFVHLAIPTGISVVRGDGRPAKRRRGAGGGRPRAAAVVAPAAVPGRPRHGRGWRQAGRRHGRARRQAASPATTTASRSGGRPRRRRRGGGGGRAPRRRENARPRRRRVLAAVLEVPAPAAGRPCPRPRGAADGRRRRGRVRVWESPPPAPAPPPAAPSSSSDDESSSDDKPLEELRPRAAPRRAARRVAPRRRHDRHARGPAGPPLPSRENGKRDADARRRRRAGRGDRGAALYIDGAGAALLPRRRGARGDAAKASRLTSLSLMGCGLALDELAPLEGRLPHLTRVDLSANLLGRRSPSAQARSAARARLKIWPSAATLSTWRRCASSPRAAPILLMEATPSPRPWRGASGSGTRRPRELCWRTTPSRRAPGARSCPRWRCGRRLDTLDVSRPAVLGSASEATWARDLSGAVRSASTIILDDADALALHAGRPAARGTIEMLSVTGGRPRRSSRRSWPVSPSRPRSSASRRTRSSRPWSGPTC